jgi:hypothetical protein
MQIFCPPQPQPNHEKNRQIPIKGQSTKYLTSTPQTCHGKISEQQSHLIGAEEDITKCNVICWMGSWKTKWTVGKDCGGMEKLWALVNQY